MIPGSGFGTLESAISNPSLLAAEGRVRLMATQSKAQFLNDVYTLLKRRYKPKADRNATRLSVLKAVVYGICHEDTSREQANQALSRFKDEFFDWNEVRVSGVEEIRESLAGIPEPEERARRIRRFLRQLFNRTYGFNLDALAKKPLKEALKVLQTYDAFASDYVTATVIQQALGGHAIPIDKQTHRALERLGITESTVADLRAVLERAVPKNRGAEFLDLLEDLAYDTCVEGEPDCPRCELRKICPFAQVRKQESASADSSHAARAAKSRPAKEKESVRTPKAKPADAASPPAHAPSPAPVKKSPAAHSAKEIPAPPKSPRGKTRGH
jgi:endonuclease-3